MLRVPVRVTRGSSPSRGDPGGDDLTTHARPATARLRSAVSARGGRGRLGLAGLAFLGSVLAAPAQDKAPSSEGQGPPQPPPRPAELATPKATGPTETPPLPPERPAALTPPVQPAAPPALPPPTDAPAPPARPPELSGEAALALKVAAPDDTACRRRLDRLGVRYEALPAITEGQCSVPQPLRVTRLGDAIALEPAAILSCRAAEALARWASEVTVAAETQLSEPPTTLSLGGSYLCRGQNHDIDAKLSEHAFANAVDVMGFGFAKHPPIKVTGLPEGTPEAAFVTSVRGKACAFFRTVLGPGSDAAHANHLHLDERERNAGHRLCE
ncbi:extensin-like domain-containing protein [Methylobacterium organophilum]|uniref:Extensin-like C-terminal domain-containing protein n=1 Tax=Methylobacterium organophilum TaxID=410 RepID=A0ABQ4T4C9_METOR|nr:extensin family protein [Methylobacterium organophilum]GJE25487.1 hypothetical protein LKMONMHP_0325 [Methylobacterium organophilum]